MSYTENSYNYSGGSYARNDAGQSKTVQEKKITAPPLLDIVEGSVKFADANGNGLIDAQEKCSVSFKLRNSGKGAAAGCTARATASGSGKVGLKIGRMSLPVVAPGQTVDVTIPIESDMSTADGELRLDIAVDEPHGLGTDPIALNVVTRAFLMPQVVVADYAVAGDNGSQIKRRTPFDLQILVQNVKEGRAENVTVECVLPANVLAMDNTSFFLGELKAGQTGSVTLPLIANNNYKGETIPVTVRIREKHGKYSEDKTLTLNLNQSNTHRSIDIRAREQQRADIARAQIDGKVGQAEVDVNIPAGAATAAAANRFAVIICNEDYRTEVPVAFARNDGDILARYIHRTLGLPQENIRLVSNATRNDIIDAVDWMGNIDRSYGADAEFIVYYAGHGLPDEKSGSPYLVPVDGKSTNLNTCVKLSDIYARLNGFASKRIVFFMDACFSGALRGDGMLASARGVVLKAAHKNPEGKLCVITAAQGDETAWPYAEKGHGMFTYFLLKKLQDTAGNVSLGELTDYVKREVSRRSVVVNNKPQTPSALVSPAVASEWQRWTLK